MHGGGHGAERPAVGADDERARLVDVVVDDAGADGERAGVVDDPCADAGLVGMDRARILPEGEIDDVVVDRARRDGQRVVVVDGRAVDAREVLGDRGVGDPHRRIGVDRAAVAVRDVVDERAADDVGAEARRSVVVDGPPTVRGEIAVEQGVADARVPLIEVDRAARMVAERLVAPEDGVGDAHERAHVVVIGVDRPAVVVVGGVVREGIVGQRDLLRPAAPLVAHIDGAALIAVRVVVIERRVGDRRDLAMGGGIGGQLQRPAEVVRPVVAEGVAVRVEVAEGLHRAARGVVGVRVAVGEGQVAQGERRAVVHEKYLVPTVRWVATNRAGSAAYNRGATGDRDVVPAAVRAVDRQGLPAGHLEAVPEVDGVGADARAGEGDAGARVQRREQAAGARSARRRAVRDDGGRPAGHRARSDEVGRDLGLGAERLGVLRLRALAVGDRAGRGGVRGGGTAEAGQGR